MKKTRLVLTSALILVGFGLMAPECGKDSTSHTQSLLRSGTQSPGAGIAAHAR